MFGVGGWGIWGEQLFSIAASAPITIPTLAPTERPLLEEAFGISGSEDDVGVWEANVEELVEGEDEGGGEVKDAELLKLEVLPLVTEVERQAILGGL